MTLGASLKTILFPSFGEPVPTFREKLKRRPNKKNEFLGIPLRNNLKYLLNSAILKKMKQSFTFNLILAVAATLFFSSCKKETAVDSSQPVISLSTYKFLGKSQQEMTVTVTINAPNGIAAFKITKGVNLKADTSFGTNGLMTVAAASGSSFTYVFKYILSPDEVDKLVGFNFRVEDSKGLAAEKDFTLNTTVSGAQLLFSYRWNLKSIIWKSSLPVEAIRNDEKDNSFLFNRDSTVTIDYGTVKGIFDGFRVYEKWTLSPDEKVFTLIWRNVFTAVKTTEVYDVTTLIKDKLVMNTFLDLSAFGATANELFEYTYTSSPK